MSDFLSRIKETFSDEESRHIYTNDYLNSVIATQIKVLRQQRRWTQRKLAEQSGMKQARISVMEDVNYSTWSLSTLRRLARAFDLRLQVSFEEFGTMVSEYEALSPKSLERRPFRLDPVFQAETQAEQEVRKLPALPVQRPTPEAFAEFLRGPAYQSTPSITEARPGAHRQVSTVHEQRGSYATFGNHPR